MKKILILMISAIALLFISCQNTADTVVKESAKTDAAAGSGVIPVNVRNLVSLGEDTEVIDSVSYTVKKYAEVYVESPYFYTYYKLYYLNNKIRRVYSYYHGFKCEMDYTYTEFVEHLCGNTEKREGESIHEIYTYYENGKMESYLNDWYEDGKLYKKERKYDSNGKLTSEKIYRDSVLTSESKYTYYSNGSKKNLKNYNNGILQDEYEYYENGNLKTSKNYKNGNLRNEYGYYESGSEKFHKEYENDILLYETLYYLGNGNGKKLSIEYNLQTGNLQRFSSYYSSGYIHYYYESFSGFLYTFQDGISYSIPNVTEGVNGITQTTITEAEGLSKLEELRN